MLTVTLCGFLLRSMEMFSNALSIGVPEGFVEVSLDSEVRLVSRFQRQYSNIDKLIGLITNLSMIEHWISTIEVNKSYVAEEGTDRLSYTTNGSRVDLVS